MQQHAPVFFGTIAQTPSDPYSSNYGGADRMVSVEIEGYGTQKIWFKDGSGFNHLQPGDVAVVEYRSGKWRFSKQQPPELVAELRQRGAARPDVQPSSNVTPIRSNDSTAQMISIFLELRRGLPQVSDEVIAKLACTLFIQSSK